MDPSDLDLAVLAHLHGYPEELRRFSNMMKQAHPHGRTATEFFVSRPADADSFVAAPGFPRPLGGSSRHQVWRRADIAAFRRRDDPPAAG